VGDDDERLGFFVEAKAEATDLKLKRRCTVERAARRGRRALTGSAPNRLHRRYELIHGQSKRLQLLFFEPQKRGFVATLDDDPKSAMSWHADSIRFEATNNLEFVPLTSHINVSASGALSSIVHAVEF
jgi:hypothetical protein